MVCQSIEEYIDLYFNKKVEFDKLTMINDDYEKLIEYCKENGESNCELYTIIGLIYYRGKGLPDGVKDYDNAAKWFDIAGKKGSSLALCNLGFMYLANQSVKKDYKKAFNLFNKVIKNKNIDMNNHLNKMAYANAINNIGYLYFKGRLGEKDVAKAVELFKKSARLGSKYAQNNLGFLYKNGYGVDKDYKEAIMWYNLAIEGDMPSPNAYRNIGEMYLYGLGVEKDYEKAKNNFELAIKIRKRYAQPYYDLGLMYYYGEGQNKDYEKAFDYFSKANELGINCDYYLSSIKKDKNNQDSINYVLEYANKYKLEKFDYIIDKVIDAFGKSWNKLDNYTKDFIEKSVRVYDFFSDQDIKGDYSQVVLELIKGLENEIKVHFVDKYKLFLEETVNISDISNKYILNEKRDSFNSNLTDRFTLGDFEKILGRSEIQEFYAREKMEKTYNERNKSKNDFRKVITIDKEIVRYLKERLFDCDGIGSNIDNTVYDYTIYLSDEIKNISQIRNLSAHRGKIEKKDAEDLINFCIFDEKFFVNLMNKIAI